jgi:hypothetical protein
VTMARLSVAWAGSIVLLATGPLGAAEQGLEPFAVTLGRAEGSAAFETRPATVLRSARARVDVLDDGCQFLTLCISDLEGVTCATAKRQSVPAGHFVLIVGMRLQSGEVVHAGEWKDLGVILRSPAGTYTAQGELGSVRLDNTLAAVAGTMQLNNGRLQVRGRFTATRE